MRNSSITTLQQPLHSKAEELQSSLNLSFVLYTHSSVCGSLPAHTLSLSLCTPHNSNNSPRARKSQHTRTTKRRMLEEFTRTLARPTVRPLATKAQLRITRWMCAKRQQSCTTLQSSLSHTLTQLIWRQTKLVLYQFIEKYCERERVERTNCFSR